MWRFLKRNKRWVKHEIAPEDIFLDSSNLPEFDQYQMEGRIEMAISQRNILVLGACFIVVMIFLGGRAYALQIINGSKYAEHSMRNSLSNDFIFADRGIITDRNGSLLAWNVPSQEVGGYAPRQYIEAGGFGNLLGYVRYPAKDTSGFYYKTELSGASGIELHFNDLLAGSNGLKIVEADVRGDIQSESTIRPPEQGEKLILSIDAEVQKILYTSLKQTIDTSGFVGGGGIIMDVHTGEVLAVATYPEFSAQVMTDGNDGEAVNAYFNDERNPFLFRAISGLYAPGSILKPFIALGALNENIISPEKEIESKGFISIPNPYNPDLPTVFRDWKINGWTDVREAIAVSSDVYFYAIGGGYLDQKGMGIAMIDKYVEMFGFAQPLQPSFFSVRNNGVIPTPEWKLETFNGDPWRLGNTYHASIGQFGFLVTPVQAVRAISALVTEGKGAEPQIIKRGEQGSTDTKTISFSGIEKQHLKTAKEGMRMAVTEGTMQSLNLPYVQVAGKTGTAEIGSQKKFIHSWSTGYFPYENPRYAFALILEKGPAEYAEGASPAMRRVFEGMNASPSTQHYLK